jgi:hypothetical protein
MFAIAWALNLRFFFGVGVVDAVPFISAHLAF